MLMTLSTMYEALPNSNVDAFLHGAFSARSVCRNHFHPRILCSSPTYRR